MSENYNAMATIRYKFTVEECVWLVLAYYQQNDDYAQMFTDFTEHLPNTPISLRQSVWKMITTFERMDSVANPSQSGCPRSLRSTDNTETVALKFCYCRNSFSTVQISLIFGHPYFKVIWKLEYLTTNQVFPPANTLG